MSWSTGASIVEIMTNIGLLATAVWAACIARKTMKASQEASRAAREANEQTRRDSIEQTRPYVFVEIVPGLAGRGTYDLRVTNSGRTSAYSLTLDYSDWPDNPDRHTRQIMRLFRAPRTLPPGCSIRSFWRIDVPDSDSKEPIGGGTEGTITARHKGYSLGAENYAESYEVLIEHSGLWPVPEDGPEPGKMEAVERRQYKVMQTIARHVGELRR